MTSETTHLHYKIYKPYGYVSQFVSNERLGHKKKYLGELDDFPNGLMAIGRLDEHSEGLLLLTTDGKLSNHVNSSGVEKEYYAQVDGIITESAISQLAAGIEISINGKKYRTKTSKVKIISTPDLPETRQRIRDDRHGPTSWISVILTEGKFRQVRKMTAAAGFATLRLARVRIGDYQIENMTTGECVLLDQVSI